MEFLQSVLYPEVQSVMNNKDSKTNYSWVTEIYYKDNEFIVPLKTIAVSINRDYENNYSDEITISTLIPIGKYAKRIFPNRNNIKIILKKKQLGEQVKNEVDNSSEILIGTYTGIILNNDNSILEGQGREADTEDVLDLSGYLEVKFQLIETNVEILRTIQVGGCYNNFNINNLLKALITKLSNGLINGLSVFKSDNVETIKQLLIPHGTLLIDLPGLVQKKLGVFNSGLGSYIQDGYWYIYYLYNTSKLEDRSDTINLIVVPTNKFPNIERSYKKENGVTTILVTGETKFKDDSGVNNIVSGHGSRISNADSLFDANKITRNNKVIISRAKNNTEFLAYGRDSKINHAPTNSDKVRNNLYIQLSDINKRTGGIFTGVWQSADDTLLKPGITAKINYCENDEVKTLHGILIKANYVSMMINGVTSEKYNNQALLTFYVNRIE